MVKQCYFLLLWISLLIKYVVNAAIYIMPHMLGSILNI